MRAIGLHEPGGIGGGWHVQSLDCGGTRVSGEREHIVRVLERCRWRINGPGNAAETLGLHPNTLRARLHKLGIERPS